MKRYALYGIATLCFTITHSTNCFKSHEEFRSELNFLNLRKKIAQKFYKCIKTKQKSNQRCLDLAESQLIDLQRRQNQEDELRCDTQYLKNLAPVRQTSLFLTRESIQKHKFNKCFTKVLERKPCRRREYENFFAALKTFIDN